MTSLLTTLLNERVEVQNTKTALDESRGFVVGAWILESDNEPSFIVRLDDGNLEQLKLGCIRVLTGEELEAEEEELAAEEEEEAEPIPQAPLPKEGTNLVFNEEKGEWEYVPIEKPGLLAAAFKANSGAVTAAMAEAIKKIGRGDIQKAMALPPTSTFEPILMQIGEFKTTGTNHQILGVALPRTKGQHKASHKSLGLAERKYPNTIKDGSGVTFEYLQPVTKHESGVLYVIGARYRHRDDIETILDLMEI